MRVVHGCGVALVVFSVVVIVASSWGRVTPSGCYGLGYSL